MKRKRIRAVKKVEDPSPSEPTRKRQSEAGLNRIEDPASWGRCRKFFAEKGKGESSSLQ